MVLPDEGVQRRWISGGLGDPILLLAVNSFGEPHRIVCINDIVSQLIPSIRCPESSVGTLHPGMVLELAGRSTDRPHPRNLLHVPHRRSIVSQRGCC